MENEKFELTLDEEQANATDAFVNKSYLINLDRYPLVELGEFEKSDEYIRLYQIERIVYDVDENANDILISVYSAFFNIQAAGLLVIKSTRNALGFYIGVRSVDNTSTAEAILEKSFKGNFAGSQIQPIPQEEVQKVLGSINKSGRFGIRQNVSSVSIVPSTRDEDKERFVQGIEKFIDTMKGSEYTAIFIAEPLDKEILEQRKRGLQKIYSSLSPLATTQLSYGENYSKAVSKGMSENFSKTLNDSLTDTTSHFNSRSISRSHGTSFGFWGIGFNNGIYTGYSSGSSWASAVTRGTSETKGETITETDTDTTGDSRTIMVTRENKSVKYILEKIDQYLTRIKNCEAFGLWDIACYFVSENVQTSVVAASTYKALMAGFDSGVENAYVNIWKQDNVENTPELLEYLRYCIHPRFSIPSDDQFFEVESQTVNPCSLISGNEMPYIMGLPHHSVPGVTVLNMAEFRRNVRFSSGASRGKKVELGQVYHMGEKETARVKLDIESFRSHCFITGSTGYGKADGMSWIDRYIEECCEDESEKEIIRFGLEQLRVLLVGIVAVLLAGFLLRETVRTILFLLCILPLRQNAGGFHLKDKWACTICSCIILICSILTMKFATVSPVAALAMVVVDTLVIMAYAPVGNVNRSLDEIEKKVYGRRARIVCVAEALAFIVFFILNAPDWYVIILLSETITGILVIIGHIQEQMHGGNKEQCTG